MSGESMKILLDWIDGKLALMVGIPAWFWKKVDGLKSAVAALYWPFVQTVVPQLYPDGDIPENMAKVLWVTGWVLSITGGGHKIVKGVKGAMKR